MRTVPCPFAGGTARLLADDVAAAAVLDRLSADIGVAPAPRRAARHPGCFVLAQPAAPEAGDPGADADRLLRAAAEAAGGDGARPDAFFLHARTSGTPHLLFLTTLGDTPVCAYVSGRVAPGHARPKIVLDGQVFCDETLFDGTALSGDLVRGDAFDAGDSPDERWVFLADDCLAVRGVCVAARPFSERLAVLRAVLAEALDQGDGWATHLLRAKAFHPCDAAGAEAAVARIGLARPYRCTGVLLRSPGRCRRDMLVAEAPPSGEAGRGTRGGPAGAPTEDHYTAAREPLVEDVTLRETGMPDVYSAHGRDGRPLPEGVSVPTLLVSQQLRSAFALSPGAGVRWSCDRRPGGRLAPRPGGGPLP